jgi:uncharacterized membrane protein YkvA (DUF1232 family)
VPILKRNPSLMHRLRVEVHAAWLAARDPRTPWPARLFGLLLTAYALSPLDIIPDFIPVLGLLDDAILIPVGLWLFTRIVPPEIMADCRLRAELASQKPRSMWGVVIVIMVWIAAALLVAWLVAWPYD